MRYLPAVGVVLPMLLTLLVAHTLIDEQGIPDRVLPGDEGNTALLIYGLLAIAAAIGAILFRSWWAVLVIPLTMLATWVLSDQIACPDCWNDYGGHYRLPFSSTPMSVDVAHPVLRSLQLLPAALGAVVGSVAGTTWIRLSDASDNVNT